MDFEQLLEATIGLLQRRRRLTYAAVKRQFGIDDATLADLSHELIRGQRLARDEDGEVLVWQAAEPASTAATEPRREGERRQLTILFGDLVDSTALSNSLDPEEMRVVLRAFQGAVAHVVAAHGGFVNSYLGDGVVAFFGYPQAAEDDAVRAVRAGLELVQAVHALRPLGELRPRVRVGIATGVVVVGDVIGEGASREEAVVGSTSNLASRLQSIAGPGEVVIAGTTARLVSHHFECVELGAQSLKGFDAPVLASRVMRERAADEADRSSPSHGSPPAPLVDRRTEFPSLLELWKGTREARGCVVTLRGEPGLGKSRLLEELRAAVAQDDPLVLRYFCAHRFGNTAFYPVVRHLQHAMAWDDDESIDTRRRELERLLRRGLPAADAARYLPYVATLIGLALDRHRVPIADSPERQREHTLHALVEHVLGLARRQPLLMLFEDLHWVDPSTLSLLERLVGRIGEARVMLIATSRPEFDAPWGELAHAHMLELGPLERDDRATIARQQARGKSLPEEIVEHIVSKSDGNPLYVEELTKASLESDLLRIEGDRYVLTGPMRGLSVPSTLHDSLLSRLDRLPDVKDVVQAGAAIGREFRFDMLCEVLQVPAERLHATLGRLLEAGLVHRRGAAPDDVYQFKHALIQDVAYSTMLRTRRRALHARIAQLLEADPVATAREPELVAHHLVEAAETARAIPYLQRAGLLASAAAAHVEACKHFEEGLRLLATLPENDERHRLELGLRVHLGMSLAATRGFAAAEVESTNQRARELCRLIGDTDELFWVLRGLCALYIVRGDARSSRELAAHLVRLAEETCQPAFLVEGYLMQGYVLSYAGELDTGRSALTKVLDVYRSCDGARLAFPTPQDPAIAALSMLAVVHAIRGEPRLAADCLREALDSPQAAQRPFDSAYAHTFAAMVSTLLRNPEAAVRHAGAAIEIAQRHGFGVWLAAGTMQLAVAKTALGAHEESIALLRATLPAWRASGAELQGGFFLAGLAAACRATGETSAALATLDEAIVHAAQHEEGYYDAELHRLRAECLASTDPNAARAAYRHALEVACRQGARLFELRAAASEWRASLRAREARAGGRAGTGGLASDEDAVRAALAQAIAHWPSSRDDDELREAIALLPEDADPPEGRRGA